MPTITVPACDGHPGNEQKFNHWIMSGSGGATWENSSDGEVGHAVFFPIIAPLGATITEVKAYVASIGSAGFKLDFRKVLLPIPGGAGTPVATKSQNVTSATTITVFSGSETVLADTEYWCRIEKASQSAPAKAFVNGIAYTYTEPT